MKSKKEEKTTQKPFESFFFKKIKQNQFIFEDPNY